MKPRRPLVPKSVTDVAEYVGTFEPGSQVWHAARAEGLGGSEVAPVLGLSPFESRFSLWHRKKGLVGPVAESPEMYAGKVLEPAIRRAWVDQHPDLPVREVGTWVHRGHRWMVANPDGLGDGFVWEAKYALSDLGWGEPGTDEIPVHYRAQVFHYMRVLGLDTARVYVFIGSTAEFRDYTITYDPAEDAGIVAACEEFLATLTTGQRPDIDEHSSTYEAIRELHPDIAPYSIDVDPELAAAYLAANAAAKDATAHKQLLTSRLADAMGDAKSAMCGGVRIAGRMSKDGGIPYVAAAPVRKNPPGTRTDTTTKENAA